MELDGRIEKSKTAQRFYLALTHYNSDKQIYVASDANNFELGAVRLHKKDGKLKLSQHVSRVLLAVEMNNLQIEKEKLAIIFAIKKFHKYVHGREFILQMDHRPLLAIFGSKKLIPTHTVLLTKMGHDAVKLFI